MSQEIEQKPTQETPEDSFEKDELTEEMLDAVVGGTSPTGGTYCATGEHLSAGGGGAGLIPAV